MTACVLCDSSERIDELLFCMTCRSHYHGSCLSPIVENNAVIRVGWQCPKCKVCKICKQSGDDSKTLVCESCDKCAHTYCLKSDSPTPTNQGWNCGHCRTELTSRACTSCATFFISTQKAFSSKNPGLCEECELTTTTSLNCLACSQSIQAKEKKKKSKQCNSCLRYAHISCDNDNGGESQYVCFNCNNRDRKVPFVTQNVHTPEKKRSSVKDLLLMSRMQNLNGKLI